ncbi:unnamed protein product [Urochloa decumbens]|uniref:F-box domain-containing protein n=1 Tax=Urochloa decumbens TaxID=240449 RepID=A0ABC9GVM5_9POAL
MASGDTDRISALPDDLLHAILAGVGEATAVTRTAVLSKRWRRVWIHAHRLQLEDTKACRHATPADCQFAGFVDWVLARRGDAGIGSLEITMSRHDCCASTEQANEWIRYGVRRVAKSFSLELPQLPSTGSRIIRRLRRRGLPPDDEADAPAAIVLPSHGRVASIMLELSRRLFQLPVAAAARYEALTELMLYGAWFDEAAAPGGGRTLGDFVSSCCPCLRNLDIMSPIGLPQLVIRSETLEVLELFFADDLHTLDVAAPSLCVLKLNLCFRDILGLSGNKDHAISKKVARIAAPTPRLEEIEVDYFSGSRRPNLDLHDTASVRRLSTLHLHMHGPYCSVDDELRLLEKCPGVEHIGVSLVHGTGATSGSLLDLTTEGAALFANVRSMNVEAPLFSGGQFVSSISSLLSRSHNENFLKYLGEVKISGFTGAEEEMDLVTLLFKSSNSIKSMTLSNIKARKRFKQEHRSGTKSFFSLFDDYDDDAEEEEDEVVVEAEEKKDDDEEEQAIIKQELMKIPSTDRGRWYFEEDEYTWMR